MEKEILINCEPLERRVAIVENRRLEEFLLERAGIPRTAGNIYKGRVASIVPGMGASFIDLGLERNGFLYVSDILHPATGDYDLLIAEPGTLGPKARERANIEEILQKGQEVLVQIVKEPIGTKGARLTTHITLAGKYVVLMPFDRHVGISRKINEIKERDRLREVMREITQAVPMGFIVRTQALGRTRREIEREVHFLTSLWERLRRSMPHRATPSLLYEEYDVVLRAVRDYFDEETSWLIVDGKEEFQQILHFVKSVAPHLRRKVVFFQEASPLFEKKGIEEEIHRLFQRRVSLQSGGSLVIEQTESMVAIDVNTGKFTGKRNLEETVFKVNLEAAEEVARQIRLRDLGGLVVIDFIDMDVAVHRRKVAQALEEAIERDRAKTNILSISELGLVEMSRQRMRRSIFGIAYQDCPYCDGQGLVRNAVTMSIEAMRDLRTYLTRHRPRTVELLCHPDVAARLTGPDKGHLDALQMRHRCQVNITPDPQMHLERIQIKETRS